MVCSFLYFNGAFESEAVVTIYADNTYDETLHIVTDIDYEPFSYVDADGNYAGLDVELIAEIANRMQMNLDLELVDWPEANARLLSGEADAILNMETDLVAEDSRMIATIPTTEKQYVVYGRERISSVAQLYGRRVASLHDLPQLGLEKEITYVDSYAAIFEGLKNGEYDFAICPIQVGNVFLNKMDIHGIQPSYAVSHVYGAIALTAEKEELKERINEVIHELEEEGFLDRLDQKWISHRYQNMTLRGMLESHPWVGAACLVIIVLLVFLSLFVMLQNRNMREKDAYTRQLQENLAVIDRQSEELLEAKNRAEASSKAKTIFLSNMSHDICTPMNAIIGYINLAKREDTGPAEVKDYLTKIEGSSQHLLALINDVLEMSRIESGKMELEEADVDLKQVMNEMYDMFVTQMQEKKIHYTVDSDSVKHRAVRCDKNRLNRVLLNLISNAYKFTPQGGSVSVILTEQAASEEGRGSYELRVKDSGIGMTAEFAEKVFEAFERERTSTVSGIQGTGLGMAITKSIVDLMGGDISVNTAQGQGTEFVLHLSFLTGDESAVSIKDKKSDAQENMPDFSRMRLLLVEDVEINREIAEVILTDVGFTVEMAVNGKEAVELVQASQPGYYNVVLMDIQMPVMDGYEATKAIRALDNKALAKVPIIAMTANAFTEDVQRAHEAGMNAHIAKPIDIGIIKKTLTEVFSDL